MRPIQFNQDKHRLERKYLTVSENVSDIVYKIRDIKLKQKFSASPKNKKRVATLLAEYYSILFNPINYGYFREPYLKDLSLLFPVNDDIYISNDTNFILLPLPLPTYRQHTQSKYNTIPFRLSNPCPFITHTSTSNELVHDMDYSQDNRRVMPPRQSQERNFIYNNIQHTNPDIKQQRLEQPLDLTARIRVYKFDDLHPQEAKTMPGFPRYSMRDRNQSGFYKNNFNLDIQNKYMSPEEFQKKLNSVTEKNRLALERYNQFVHRQYTFLEITPININPRVSTGSVNNKLQSYSKYLEQTQLNIGFAKCFNFTGVSKDEVIKYFMNNLDCNEYSPAQIKSGIKKLNNIIKYKKPKSNKATVPVDNDNMSQDKVKFNQHVRSLNIKQSDGTFKSQLIEDGNITNRTSLENTKPLYSNKPSEGLQQ